MAVGRSRPSSWSRRSHSSSPLPAHRKGLNLALLFLLSAKEEMTSGTGYGSGSCSNSIESEMSPSSSSSTEWPSESSPMGWSSAGSAWKVL